VNPIESIKTRAWHRQVDPAEREYQLSTVLPHATKSVKRINYTTIFLIGLAVFFAVSYIFFR
jgi:hypothetical protein